MAVSTENDKSSVTHVDAIDANTSEPDVTRDINSANEEIVQHLQTTGEEVGMTWRSFMAASVSLYLQLILDGSDHIVEHGHVLFCLSFHALDTTGDPQFHQC
jgi:hypothetical protein